MIRRSDPLYCTNFVIALWCSPTEAQCRAPADRHDRCLGCPARISGSARLISDQWCVYRKINKQKYIHIYTCIFYSYEWMYVYRGLDDCLDHFGICLRYVALKLYWESGTIILVIFEAPCIFVGGP